MDSYRRTLFRPTLMVCASMLCLRAQPSPEKTARITLDRGDVQAVIDMARVAPPEFGADAMITLVESGLIPDRRAARDVLEEAFGIAANAQERIALKRGSGDSAVTGALHGAFRNGIDQASLRSRAVQAMLRYDARTARDLFERIELPISASTGCEQQTIPDLSLYYVTMWEVAKGIPDRAQLAAFLNAQMPRFRSAAQITPFARVFMQLREIERMPTVIDAFSERLPDLVLDQRVFSSTFDEAIEAIGQLITSVAPSNRERLIQQSRTWVMRNANFGVCAESPRYSVSFDGKGRTPIPFVEPRDRFNQEIGWHSRAASARIEPSEIGKPDTGSMAAPVSNSKQYLEHFRTHLLLSRDDEGALDLGRWGSEMENYIGRLIGWQASNATDYLEKSDLLTHVLFIERHAPGTGMGPVKINWNGSRKPNGPRMEIPGRDRVLTALVDLFDGEAAQKIYADRRVIWFSPVRDMLAISGMADLYASTKHPVLSLYGHLAKLTASR